MKQKILITGGAGFIGSHLADELLEQGYRVRVYDALSPQVHGSDASRPAYLSPEAEFIEGTMENAAGVRRALRGIDRVYHLAAKVGVGQSMYRIADYVAANNQGTAVLLEEIVRRPVQRLVVASSMSVYGEGLYHDVQGNPVANAQRSLAQLQSHRWEPVDRHGRPLVAVPTPESKTPSLSSVYALSKFDQEQMCLMVGRAYQIPTVALRFFNVYGPRQALSNPYTGVLAIFASQLLNGLRPVVYEDGCQQRDFVNVSDVARACRLAMETPGATDRVFNIASGERQLVRDLARRLARILGKDTIEPEITERYRVGDIRHCIADISLAREFLGYEPKVSFEAGIEELAGWLEGQIATARAGEARMELSSRGLTV